MSSEKTPLAVAINAVQRAVEAGADDADAYVEFNNRLDLEVVNGVVENLRRAAARGLGLRVTKDGKTVLVHSTDLSLQALGDLARRALDMAASLPTPKEPVLYASPQQTQSLPHPDPGIDQEILADKRSRLVEVERAMLSVPGVDRTVGVAWEESEGIVALANTKGVELQSPFVRLELGAEAIAERDGESYSGSRRVRVPSRRRLPDLVEFGKDAGKRAVEMVGARPVVTTSAPVIFTPQTGWALLVYLLQPLMGDSVVEGRSYLGGEVGEKIAAEGVTVRDSPLLGEGVNRRSFDAEGSPAKNLVLVENGILRNYLTDLKSAAKLGIPCGGNTKRDSYDTGIEIGSSNCYMDPGGQPPDEIIAATERGLLVTLLAGWWVGLSPSKDVFSSAAWGHWIENGKKVHPVRGVSVGGTLREMLKNIDMIGNDLEIYGRTSSPTFRVSEMAISGI